MSKHKQSENGFAVVETLLVLVIIAIIGFVGWFVVRARHDTDKNFNNSGSSQAANTSGKAGSGTNDQSLQDDLSGINSANSETAKDLNNSNSGLNDRSTFTSLP